MDEQAAHTPPMGTIHEGPVEAQQPKLRALYQTYWQELCRYGAKVFGAGPPEPEDLAQAAFAKLAAHDRPEEIKNPRAYLYRALHNEAVDYHRRQATRNRHQGQVQTLLQQGKADELTAERVLMGKEHIRLIEEVVKKMPEKKRQVLLLSCFEGWTKADIARHLGLSQTHVKRLLAQAITECRAQIDDPSQTTHQKGRRP